MTARLMVLCVGISLAAVIAWLTITTPYGPPSPPTLEPVWQPPTRITVVPAPPPGGRPARTPPPAGWKAPPPGIGH